MSDTLSDKADAMPDAETESAEVKRLKAELKDARDLIDRQCEHLDEIRKSRLPSIDRQPRRTHGESFLRVVIPDSHGSAVEPAAFAAMVADIEAIQPKQAVWLGDHIDCGGFLAEHHTWGYVAEMGYSYADDIAHANAHLDAVAAIVPENHYIEGNHERRVETWCVTEAMRSTRGKNVEKHLQSLLRTFAVENELSLKERGFQHYKQGRTYDGDTPATLKLGKAVFTHGIFTNKHAAEKHAGAYGANIFFGHTHRAQSYYVRTGMGHTMLGMCHGCLCKLQPLWNHTRPTNWTHGYGLQLVRPDGSFLPIHVPIIDGESLLADLADKIR